MQSGAGPLWVISGPNVSNAWPLYLQNGHAPVRMECPPRAKSGHRSAGYRRSSCNRGRLCHVPHHFDFGPRSGDISKSITAVGSSSARFRNTAANESARTASVPAVTARFVALTKPRRMLVCELSSRQSGVMAQQIALSPL
jgi:hypothetical protein